MNIIFVRKRKKKSFLFYSWWKNLVILDTSNFTRVLPCKVGVRTIIAVSTGRLKIGIIILFTTLFRDNISKTPFRLWTWIIIALYCIYACIFRKRLKRNLSRMIRKANMHFDFWISLHKFVLFFVMLMKPYDKVITEFVKNLIIKLFSIGN